MVCCMLAARVTLIFWSSTARISASPPWPRGAHHRDAAQALLELGALLAVPGQRTDQMIVEKGEFHPRFVEEGVGQPVIGRQQ